MDLPSKLQGLAKKNCPRIGIGQNNSKEGQKIIKRSVTSATNKGYAEVIVFNSHSELVNALKNDEISGAVRGTLSAKETLDDLKRVFKLVSIYRSALICIAEKSCFFLAPVGIDEGIFIDERLQFIKLIDSLLQRLDITSETAIISGGRMDDYGRSGLVDESLRAGVKLFKLAKEAGINAKHFGILIEDAYKDSNIIIAPNGIVGNLLFRTLHFLGNARSLGAPVLNMDK
ncbi:MAG: methyltransferase, partial [Thermoplasmata archaeon]|nr:methyltransferase [Thermoplasmata archaeon]